MIEFNFDKYKIAIQTEKEPEIYQMWLEHASFKDIDGLQNDGTPIYIGVGQEGKGYETVIAYCSDPIGNCGFNPGFLIVPETGTLFIGAGKVVRTYDLKNHNRKIEKKFSCGFWGWSRHNNLILMQEELEFGIYTLDGLEVWSTFVEPPWTYEIEDEHVKLTFMDKISYRDLKTGELKNK